VKAFEVAMVVVCGAFGVRSLMYWIRRPFDSADPRDHALFAFFVTGRVGLWFAIAGLFLLYALTDTQGRAFVDDVRTYDWFLLVFVALSAMQLVAGYFLGRRETDDD
jgi:hypothetical protein